MNLQFIANNADAMLTFGLFGLMSWCVVWLTRRGLHFLHEGTYYRTYIRGLFRWNRVYRYGMPVYVVAWSSIGGAVVIVIAAAVKLFVYPLHMPFWWRIPFESLWQGLPIPLLGYIFAEWLHERQVQRKRKRSLHPTPNSNQAVPLEVIQRLADEDTSEPLTDASPDEVSRQVST